jgi:nitrogenase-stabilizing/protective protein
MSETLAKFNQLTDAEQYFQFFNLPYDPTIVNVNRLHILQQFSNSIKTIQADLEEANEEEILSRYRAALQQAYGVFLTSNSLEQKLFKVFHDKPQNVVLLSDIHAD